MLERNLFFFITIIFFSSIQVLAQASLNSNPNDAQLVISDIDNFWVAYDSAEAKSIEEQKKIFQELYLDKATASFQSWIEKREKEVDELVEGINHLRPFYESIRENTLKVGQYEKDIRAAFYAIKFLYPDASFPDVYFFVWYFLSSGSTTSDEGLLIATETQTVDENTLLDQFPAIHHPMIKSLNLDNLTALVAHEAIHLQQPDIEDRNLLELAVREGTADFVAELATGRNPSQAVHTYANPKEADLWEEFKEKMYGDDMSGWIGIPNDRPAGLAYWMGYKIVEAYYQKYQDKTEAINVLLNTT